MKKKLLLIVAVLFTIASFAQDTIATFADVYARETTRANAEYSRKKYKVGNGWGFKDYYKSGKLHQTGTFSDDSSRVKEGVFVRYNEKGVILESVTYHNNTVEGPIVYYYENGAKHMEGSYIADKMSGEWIGYYESGKISGKAKYENDKQVSAEFFNEDGSANRSMKIFFRQAEFPGGSKGLIRFLNENLQYPKKAVDKNIQGTVVVQFKVGKDGTLSDFAVAKSVDPSLDKEALRVVKAMPGWTPAIYGGRLSDYYAKQPITFKLER